MQLDVKTAFLYPEIEEKIFMELPEGYDNSSKVCQLKKLMYVLKQAPKVWYAAIDDYLLECSFVKSEGESNLYILSLLFLILYVDDILIFSQSLGSRIYPKALSKNGR